MADKSKDSMINQLLSENERLNVIIDDLEDKIDKVIEYCKLKIKEQKELTDYSKYYLENYDKAINLTHSTHSGVMLETIKSTTIKRYEDILELLGDKENG